MFLFSVLLLISGSQLLCFSAFPLFYASLLLRFRLLACFSAFSCFPAFLFLCLSASPLFCFSLLFCFFAFCFLLPCFSLLFFCFSYCKLNPKKHHKIHTPYCKSALEQPKIKPTTKHTKATLSISKPFPK